MTEDEAIAIANNYIVQRLGPNPKLAGAPCTLQPMGANWYKDNTWSVLYKTVMIELPEDVVDGPMIVVVDPLTREAKFFNELFE